VTIDVTPAIIPVINWSNPAPIVLGTALSSQQLNATASHNGVAIPGGFTYTPPAGTILELGAGQELLVEFVPDDQLLYETTSKTVSIDVTTKLTPLLTWASPSPITVGTALSSTQLNATATHNGIPVAGIFTYTPAAGTVLPLGTGQVLSVNFVPADGTTYSTVSKTVTIDVISAPSSTFYRAINLNGPALSIDGNSWTGSAGAPNFSYTTNGGLFSNQAIGLNPSTDASRASMIRSSIWGKSVALNVTGVPAGSYQVWLYVWEDNFAQTYTISLEGGVVQANFNSGTTGAWRKLGPYPVTISDGAINLSVVGGDANLSGIEIWRSNQGQPGARIAFEDDIQGEILPEDADAGGLQMTVYPNPSSGLVNIEFTTVESGVTHVAVYNTRGEQLQILYNTVLPAGRHAHIEMQPAEWVNGIYVIQLINGKIVKYVKVALAR
jgi:Secretion system C-terminal sorting domain